MLADALVDRIRALAQAGRPAAGFVASDGERIAAAAARAQGGWPREVAPFVHLPIAGRWSFEAEAVHAGAPERIALWRGGSHVADDARAAGLAYARLAQPLGLALLEVDERGEFGAFTEPLSMRERLLDPATPAMIAAVDAADDGPPWLTLTLAAIVRTRRLVAVLPSGAEVADVTVAGSAFAAVLAHHAGPVTCHRVG